MLKGRKSHQTPTFLEGTPGLYVKRESPPRVPSTAPAPSKTDATGAKPSRSLSGSTVSLMTPAVPHNVTPLGASGSSTPALVASHLYSSAASIATIGGPIPQTPTGKGQGFGNFSNAGYSGMHRDASGRRLSHTPIRPHRRAAPRHELSSHSFNNPPSSHSNRNVAFSAGLRGYADSAQRQATNRRHLASSLSFGNVVEPLNEISSQQGTNDNLTSTGNTVQQQILRQKSSISSVSGMHSSQTNSSRQVSGSLQSLPGRMSQQTAQIGSSILQESHPSIADSEAELPLPHNWEMAVNAEGTRYYIDHNTKRTSWIHPLAVENLVPGWIKIFDQVHGVVYYNEIDHRSQFEHPGIAGPLISATNASQNKVSMHPTASVQSMAEHMLQSQQQQMPHQFHQTHQILEEPIPTPTFVEDLNIIDNTGVPEWIRMYSEAPFEADHLLDWKLFQLPQLEEFDHMLLKLYKQDAINIVIRYERPRREINHELAQRQITS